MKLIKQEKLDKKITQKYSSDFILADDGLYLIEIIASAKSWRQNLKSFKSLFKDDDISLTLDRIEITTSTSGKADVRPAWNGNELKGLFKTVAIAVKLKKGKHVLNFTPDQSPYLKSVIISQAEETNTLIYIPTENNPAEKSDRRPWLSFILINLSVKDISISAKADQRGRDDDDIKLIIDGEIQKNQDKKSHHQDWYWCGKVSKGRDKELKKTVDFHHGFHYLDLWADYSPFLGKIELTIINEAGIRIPTVDEPEWTGDFKDDSEQMILARAIFGEARSLPAQGRIAVGWSIKNRVIDFRWGDNYHDVILKPKQYSAFNLNDKNLPYARNPFLDKTQIDDWHECYKIAGQVMAGEVQDPTEGANHYYSNFKKPPFWTKDKNAHFKLKIGNTLFYEIKLNKAGFIKIKILIIIFASFATFVLLVYGGLYWAVAINNRLSCEQSFFETYGNEEYKYFYINPKTEEVEAAYFDQQGKILRTVELTHDGYPKSQVIVFPYTEMFGYFANLHKKDEPVNYPYREERDRYYRNYVSLMIKRREFGDPEEVFRGDVLTSSWKWKDRSHVIVYQDCGLNCLMPYEIDVTTGRTIKGEPSLKEEKTIDVLEAPLDKLVKGEYGEAFFTANGKKQRVVYKNKAVDHLVISPARNKAGFFYESGDYYESCHKIALAIVNIQDKEAKKVFEANCKISSWEWINGDQAAIYENCGSECQALHLVDVNSAEENTLQYGVDYSWSPNKELVLAYNFSSRYGITVGDKAGNELLTILREQFAADNKDLVLATRAVWSPNSAKLAVVIKKEKKDKMEVLIYDAKNNFKKIYQADMLLADIPEIHWSDNSNNIVYGGLVVNLN